MTEIDNRDARKSQGSDQRFEVMMTVNDVWRLAETFEVVDDRYRGAPQFLRDVTEEQTECNWPVSSLEQCEGHIANVGLRASARAERIIR